MTSVFSDEWGGHFAATKATLVLAQRLNARRNAHGARARHAVASSTHDAGSGTRGYGYLEVVVPDKAMEKAASFPVMTIFPIGVSECQPFQVQSCASLGIVAETVADQRSRLDRRSRRRHRRIGCYSRSIRRSRKRASRRSTRRCRAVRPSKDPIGARFLVAVQGRRQLDLERTA